MDISDMHLYPLVDMYHLSRQPTPAPLTVPRAQRLSVTFLLDLYPTQGKGQGQGQDQQVVSI